MDFASNMASPRVNKTKQRKDEQRKRDEEERQVRFFEEYFLSVTNSNRLKKKNNDFNNFDSFIMKRLKVSFTEPLPLSIRKSHQNLKCSEVPFRLI